MDCCLPGSSAHGIFQARVLEWGAIAFSDSNIRGGQKREGEFHRKTFYAQAVNLGSLLKHIYIYLIQIKYKIKNYAYTYTCASMHMCDFFCMCSSSSIYIILILYLIFILRVYFNRLP